VTYLYPRLLGGRAEQLFDEFAGIPSPDSLVERARTHDDSAVYVATGGARVPVEKLRELATDVRQLSRIHGFPQKAERAVAFDVSLARLLHQSMEVLPAEAAAREMWAFLSLVLLPDVAYWRFPAPPRDRVMHTDITRHVFSRLWWRADLVHDPTCEDPYEVLAILGEADFDQVYSRRKQIGASPAIVRNLIRVWSELRENGELALVNDRQAFRNTLMVLSRVVPFLSLNALDDGPLVGELRRIARQAIGRM
jgi:hypothetical protein